MDVEVQKQMEEIQRELHELHWEQTHIERVKAEADAFLHKLDDRSNEVEESYNAHMKQVEVS